MINVEATQYSFQNMSSDILHPSLVLKQITTRQKSTAHAANQRAFYSTFFFNGVPLTLATQSQSDGDHSWPANAYVLNAQQHYFT